MTDEASLAEFRSLIEDLASNPYLRNLANYPGHKIFNNNSGRLRHSYAVAWLSYRLAKRLNLDPVVAARAGLLHDIGYTNEEGFFNNILLHANRGAKRAGGIGENGEVCEIISRHMFPLTRPPASKHAWLVWLADKTAAVLEFLGLERLVW
jgi:uncharacterized protein